MAALVALGAALRAPNLGAPAFCCDEFFDVFAARSWLAGDGFQVPGREYTRALLMTRLTGVSFALFGVAEWSARLPALLFGLLILPVVYLAGRFWFGSVAGIVALGLTAVSVHAIDTSRFARLYSLLTLLLLCGAMAAYLGLEGRRRAGPVLSPSRIGWFAAAGLLLLTAATLHPVTVSLGVAFLAYVLTLTAVAATRGQHPQARVYGLYTAALVLAAAAAFALPEIRERLIRAALEPLPWYNPRPGDAWVHHAHLSSVYGWLWYLVLPASVVITWRRFRAGLFVSLLFWLPFLFVSAVVATKHPRYSVQFLPFAWLIIGGAAQMLASSLRLRLPAALVPAGSRARLGAGVTAAVVALPLLYMLLKASPFLPAAARRPFQATGVFTTGYFYDWREASRVLRPILPSDAVIVADLWHESIYYLERDAYQLLAAHRQMGAGDWETPERDVSEKIQRREHFAGARASRPVWVLASRERWQSQRFFDEELTRHVEQTCRPVALPPTITFAVVFNCGGPYPDGT
jgi:4-amino-4-deoxy-L-arabinose transferase-like glycosyltransferase